MVFFGAGCYDAIETIRGVIEKLSNHRYAKILTDTFKG
jgi:hypothetical protein